MKRFNIPVAGVTPIVRGTVFMPRTKLEETSLFGISIEGGFVGENTKDMMFAPIQSNIIITPLDYRCPTFTDVIAAMYWDGEDCSAKTSLGHQVETWGYIAHKNRVTPWHVLNYRGEWQIREKGFYTDDFGLMGKVSAKLSLTPSGKIEKEVTLSLKDWYVFLNSIPIPSKERMAEMYKDNPPRQIVPYRGEWNEPTACPWDEK